MSLKDRIAGLHKIGTVESKKEPEPEHQPQVGGPAPWAFSKANGDEKDCPACNGSGWDGDMKACRICIALGGKKADRPKPDDYEITKDENGMPVVTPKTQQPEAPSDPINGDLPKEQPKGTKAVGKGLKIVTAPEPGTATEPATEPATPLAPPETAPKAPQSTPARKAGKQASKAKGQQSAAQEPSGGAAVSYIVCVDCHIQTTPGLVVVRLNDLLFHGAWGEAVAKECGAPDYINSDPFRRRDAVIALAPAFAKTLKDKVLEVNTGNVEENQVYSAFLCQEAMVIRRN